MQLAILKLLLELASLTAKYLHDKRLMDAGAAQAILESLNNANNQIAIAKRAMADANSVSTDTDPHNRDNLV